MRGIRKVLLMIACVIGAAALSGSLRTYAAETDLSWQDSGFTPEEIGSYYKDSVIIGDSVAYGYSLYAAKHASDPLYQNLKFLTHGSYSLHNAFMPISKKSQHPVYMGQQRFVWDSIPMLGAKHIYTFFGLNDVGVSRNAVYETPQLFLKLIGQIRKQTPDVQVTIISTTYMYPGSARGSLNNANLRTLNAEWQKLARDNGWEYIDVADSLVDGNGNLKPEYCSDGYVHQTAAAYDVWDRILKNHAAQKLTEQNPGRNTQLILESAELDEGAAVPQPDTGDTN